MNTGEGFMMNSDVRQGCILSRILFNLYIYYAMRQVIQQANVQSITLSYHLGDSWLSNRGNNNYGVHLLTLMHADDIIVMCDSTKNLEHFIKVFARITQDFGLNLNVQKACTMSLKQLEKRTQSSEMKGKNNNTPLNIVIRDQKIETADSFNYFGCYVANHQTQSKEIEIRLGKAFNAFNSHRRVVWY